MDHKKRLDELVNSFELRKTDGMLISSVSNIIYFTGLSMFSATEREAFVLITKNSAYVITDGRYIEEVKTYKLPFAIVERSGKFSNQKILKKLCIQENVHRLGIEEDNLTVAEYRQFQKSMREIVPVELSLQRRYKDPAEIDLIKQACNLGDKTFSFVLTKIRHEISEKELAFEIEYYLKKNGAAISFPPIVAFGPNAAVPHHQTDDTRLKENVCVLFDFGAKVNGYCSDMTRTVFFGKATAGEKKIYQTVLDAQTKAIEHLKLSIENKVKNIIASSVDNVARDYIMSQGYPSIPHSLGHGIGLQVHEAPLVSPHSKEILQTGMVFSIEPGIYSPEVTGVRIEDVIRMTDSGIEILTKSAKQLREIC